MPSFPKSLLVVMGSMAALVGVLAPRSALTAGSTSAAFIPAAARTANGAPTPAGVTRRFHSVKPVSTTFRRVAAVGSLQNTPETVDLSQFCPPVQDQGNLPTDPFWATAYYQRGWYAKRDGNYPSGGPDGAGGFSMMYIAAQVNGEAQDGVTMDYPFGYMWSQGVDSREHYSGDADPTNVPTPEERQNAGRYGVLSWSQQIFYDTETPVTAVRSALAAGDPVVVAFKVYESYLEMTPSNYHYVREAHQEGDELFGGHAVTAMGYDREGVWVVDSFGTGFGLNGWVHMSWKTVGELADTILTMVPQPATPFILKASAYAGSPGDLIRLSGKEFSPGRTVSVFWNDASETALARGRVARDGTLKLGVRVPRVGHGHNRLLLVQDDGLSMATELTVLPQVTLQKSSGSNTSRRRIVGSGFPANAEVRLNWDAPDGPEIGFVPTDAKGAFRYRFTLPDADKGKKPVRLVVSADAPAYRGQYYSYNSYPTFLALYPYEKEMSPSVRLPRRRN